MKTSLILLAFASVSFAADPPPVNVRQLAQAPCLPQAMLPPCDCALTGECSCPAGACSCAQPQQAASQSDGWQWDAQRRVWFRYVTVSYPAPQLRYGGAARGGFLRGGRGGC